MKILIYNWRDIKNPDAGGAEVFTHKISKRWAAVGETKLSRENEKRLFKVKIED